MSVGSSMVAVLPLATTYRGVVRCIFLNDWFEIELDEYVGGGGCLYWIIEYVESGVGWYWIIYCWGVGLVDIELDKSVGVGGGVILN